MSSCDSYFVILNTGLYLYNFNNQDCSLIHEFKGNEYRDSNNILLMNIYLYIMNILINCIIIK